MFDRDFEKVEKSWNVSQRIMLDVPRRTHRYFIEPLSGTRHVRGESYREAFLEFYQLHQGKSKRCTTMRTANDRGRLQINYREKFEET